MSNITQEKAEKKPVSEVAASGFTDKDLKSDEETNTMDVVEFNRSVRSKGTAELLKLAQAKAGSEIVEIMDFDRNGAVQIGVKSGSFVKEKMGGAEFVNTNEIPGSMYISHGKAKMKMSFDEAIGMANDILDKASKHREYVDYCLSFGDDIARVKGENRRKF
ncbi:MAG: hypothetical protein RBR02_09470 [Desulfuromonadaceae bacterium]|nr:hypothetical protein [Desulfuromonadaceae bacterium]